MITRIFFALSVVGGMTGVASGQINEPVPRSTAQPVTSPTPTTVAAPAEESIPIDIEADRLEYRDQGKTWVADGNVTIRQGESILKADSMTVDTDTHDVYGKGNIDVRHDGRIYQGDEFYYNMKTRQGDFGDFDVYEGPWHLSADETERLGADVTLLHNATITTCKGDNPEFYIRARESTVIAGQEARSKHVFFYLGGVPFFYLPAAKTNLTGDPTNIDVVPGYSSRMGGFLLTAYNYRLNEWLEAATRVDYRSKRGFAFGQDLRWKDWGEEQFEGEASVYFIDDDRPFEDDADEAATGDLVDNERYRVKLRHRQNFSPDDILRVRSDYLSDPDVLEDFFDREFRYNTEPENFAALTHWDADYSASLNLNHKVNDFYSNVNRTPELLFDVPRLQLGESSFYWNSRNSAAFLTADFADQVTDREDYDSGRIDADNTIFFYSKHFGFLNVIPRARYAATYYSEVPDITTITNVSISTNGVGEVVRNESEVTQLIDGGGDIRNVFELGLESSFKAFKILDGDQRGSDVGRRHVFEPFINYTFIPEPNLEGDEVYLFDGIDQRDEVNDLLFGARNKLQTKRNGSVHDLLDVNVFSIYNVSQTKGETDDIPDVFWDAEWRWFPGLSVEIDGNYGVPESELETFNTQAIMRFPDRTSLSLEHRYAVDTRDLIAAELNLWPQAKWSYTGYVRHNLEEDDLEEHSHFVRYRTECLGIGLGVREIDSDITVWAQLWLLAFPQSVADLGR